MLLTNIVLILAFVLMIAIAIALTRDGSAKGVKSSTRPQVRIVDADADDKQER